MPDVIIIPPVTQVSTSSDGATATMAITYNIEGPQTEVDFVQLYAVNAAAADASLVGAANFVQYFDVTPLDPQYHQQFQLAAGTIYTLFLCPRSGSQENPDEQFNGEFWEDSCVSIQVTTKTTPPTGTGLVPPKIISVVPQPTRVNQGNSIAIAWTTPSVYQQFQIAPTYDGETLMQGQTTGTPAPESWTMQTAPGHVYTFAVQGGVWDGAANTYTWSVFGPRVSVTAVANLRSLRLFLQYSGINPAGAVLSSIKPHGDTLRRFMQL
jgi:hypothetical protein